MGLVHMVEGLGALGSRAAAQLAASRLQDKKKQKKPNQNPISIISAGGPTTDGNLVS